MKLNKKIIQRTSSVCVAISILLSNFLFCVSADTFDDLYIHLNYSVGYTESSDAYTYIEAPISNYQTYNIEEPWVEGIPMDNACLLRLNSTIRKNDNSFILRAGEKFDISVSGLVFYLYVNGYSNLFYWNETPDRIYFELIHPDGTTTVINNLNWAYSTGSYSQTINATGITEKDVVRIDFHEYVRQVEVTGMRGVLPVSLGMGSITTPTILYVTIQSEEAGLLEGIGDKIDSGLTDIGDKIDSGLTDVGDKIDSGFSDVLNGSTQQNQQVNNSLGGLNSSTDKLGQIGDQMSSVEKPTIDSNKISADSLVPNTALVTLASPFHALWENNQLLAMLTIVVSVVLVSWVFFGKKA